MSFEVKVTWWTTWILLLMSSNIVWPRFKRMNIHISEINQNIDTIAVKQKECTVKQKHCAISFSLNEFHFSTSIWKRILSSLQIGILNQESLSILFITICPIWLVKRQSGQVMRKDGWLVISNMRSMKYLK